MRLQWKWVLLGAALAVALGFVLGMVGAATGSPALTALLGATAYVLTGAITRWLGASARAHEPAIGAALATAVIAGIQILLVRHRAAELGVARLLLSWLASVALAYGLTWVGARLAGNLQRPVAHPR